MLRRLLLSLFLLISSLCQAQLYPVSFEEKFSHATLIAEGTVISQYAFWNDAHTMIYTASTLRLTKVFSGTVPDSLVEVVTTGGTIGNEGMQASELLTLDVGDAGIFFLYPNELGLHAPRSGALLWDVYASSQGAIRYNGAGAGASAPFVRYPSVDDLHAQLIGRAGHLPRYLSMASPKSGRLSKTTKITGSISSISPATPLAAGAYYDTANNLLTINGTGFGSPSGSSAVIFDNPDDGSGGSLTTIAYNNNSYVINWDASGTQIKIRVPEKAGTGKLYVRDNVGVLVDSTTIVVRYSCIGAVFGGTPLESNLMNANSFGGYSIVYGNNTAGSGRSIVGTAEQATVQRAIATHKNLIGFNLKDSSGTTLQTVNASDGVNIVQFDNTNTGVSVLPAGVLAICYSGFVRCGTPANAGLQNKGFDITIRNNGVSSGTTGFVVNFCAPYPDSAAYVDLESVLLHEFGHAENQDHIIEGATGTSYPQINPPAVMHYAISNAVKRNSPDLPLLLCGTYEVTPQGNPYGSCPGFPNVEMTPATDTISARDECSSVTTLNTVPSAALVAFDLVHATYNRTTDPQATALNGAGTVTSITNTQYYGFKTTTGGTTLTITVSGYTTYPAFADTCHAAGVQLALYAVSSCPMGGSFPAPAATRTFNANGALSSMTLATNTAYLLIVDRVENTKSTFNLSFGGTALPITVFGLDGHTEPGANVLHWVQGKSEFQELELQRGINGKDYSSLAIIGASGAPGDREYRDTEYRGKDNFYRLKWRYADGSIAYSNVVRLSRSDNEALFAVLPNPAVGAAFVHYYASAPAPVEIVLHSAAGAALYHHTFEAAKGTNSFTLPVQNLAPGYYSVMLRNTATGEMCVGKLMHE